MLRSNLLLDILDVLLYILNCIVELNLQYGLPRICNRVHTFSTLGVFSSEVSSMRLQYFCSSVARIDMGVHCVRALL